MEADGCEWCALCDGFVNGLYRHLRKRHSIPKARIHSILSILSDSRDRQDCLKLTCWTQTEVLQSHNSTQTDENGHTTKEESYNASTASNMGGPQILNCWSQANLDSDLEADCTPDHTQPETYHHIADSDHSNVQRSRHNCEGEAESKAGSSNPMLRAFSWNEEVTKGPSGNLNAFGSHVGNTRGKTQQDGTFCNPADTGLSSVQLSRQDCEDAVEHSAGLSKATLCVRPRINYGKVATTNDVVVDGCEDRQTPGHQYGHVNGGIVQTSTQSKRSKHNIWQTCNNCSRKVRGKKNLQKHMAQVHGTSPSCQEEWVSQVSDACLYLCPHCTGKPLKNSNLIYKHLQRKHPEMPRDWSVVEQKMMTKKAYHKCVITDCGRTLHADMNRIRQHSRGIHRMPLEEYIRLAEENIELQRRKIEGNPEDSIMATLKSLYSV